MESGGIYPDLYIPNSSVILTKLFLNASEILEFFVKTLLFSASVISSS